MELEDDDAFWRGEDGHYIHVAFDKNGKVVGCEFGDIIDWNQERSLFDWILAWTGALRR
jgi:hypothetical protein